MLYAVIMAGGSGTRLWPLSRQSQPKQALKLLGDRTTFQHTVDRLAPLIPPERILVIANQQISELLRPQAPDLPPENFIVEPSGRDSGPAVGLAAVHVMQRDPNAVMATLAADHYIADTEHFRGSLAAAAQVAAQGAIVTLGIQPTWADPRFGYIELGAAQEIVDGFRVYEAAAFVEKPDPEKAVRLLEDGRHVWNSGMFIWQAARLLREFAVQMPESHRALTHVGASLGTADADRVLAEEWPNVRRISIDYGIMERAQNVSVIPVSMGWVDIGSWQAVADALPGDAQGNSSLGELIALDARGCYVRSDGRLVALIGVEDLIVVDTPDALLVCPRNRAQDVKNVVARLSEAGKMQYL
jgi:mannose-1-phosphate guanylyltransferase